MQAYTEEQRKGLIGWSKKYILVANRTVETHPNDESAKANLALHKMALAVLKAKPVGTVRIEMDWNTHRNVATLDMREDLVVAEMRNGDALYTAPPAPPRDLLRQLVDIIWNDATESTTVPSTTHADALIDKVFSITAQPVSQRYKLPDGWKLVPIEPTEDMVIRGFESKPDEFWSMPEEWAAFEAMSGCQQAAHIAKLCWQAMLAAAPEPE